MSLHATFDGNQRHSDLVDVPALRCRVSVPPDTLIGIYPVWAIGAIDESGVSLAIDGLDGMVVVTLQ